MNPALDDTLRALARAGRRHGFRQAHHARHNTLNLALLVLLLAAALLVLLALRGASAWPVWAVALGGGTLLGWIGFALLILVVHEASHGMFVLVRDDARRRHWNRAFGRVVALPFAFDYHRHWEQGHTVHHRRPLEADDPQQFNCLHGAALARRLALYLLVPGGMLVDRFAGRRRQRSAVASGGVMGHALLFWVAVLVPLCWRSGPAPALAVLWGLQVTAALNEIKGSLEHGGALREMADARLRSRSTLFPGRALLMPFNISLHFEHHLNPSVPWYRLAAYHRDLRRQCPPALSAHVLRRVPAACSQGGLR